MDWDLAKERNRDALLRIVAVLFASVGLVSGGMIALLPRHLRLSVLRQVRSAEAALLRLIVIAARGMVLKPRTKSAPPAPGSIQRGTGERALSFPITERLQQTRQDRVKYAPGLGPRMFFFDGSDPEYGAAPPAPTPDDLVDAANLCRRLNRLQAVLENLEKHARRYARWQAKREAAAPRSGRTRPLRPGRPPGHRARPTHEIDEILKDCHDLALRVLAPP